MCGCLSDEAKGGCAAAAEYLCRSERPVSRAYYSVLSQQLLTQQQRKWKVCLRGALLIFTNGNNAPMVMNGVVLWEIRSNVRSGRDDVGFLEDCQALMPGVCTCLT